MVPNARPPVTPPPLTIKSLSYTLYAMKNDRRLLDKHRIAAALQRVPRLLKWMHHLWRLTRPRFTVGVMGVVFDHEGRVLLVEHVYHASPNWGLPGGYVDRGESLETAVVRELHEELSLTVRVVGIAALEYEIIGHLDAAYLCEAESEVGALSAELLNFGWFALDALPPIHKVQRRAIHAAAALSQVKFQV